MGSMVWLGFAIAAAAFWGMQNTLLEQVIKSVPLLAIGLIISLVSSCVLFGVYLVGDTKVEWATLLNGKMVMLLAGLVLVTMLGNFGIWASIQGKNATVAGMIEASYPLFTVLFSYLLFRDGHINMLMFLGFTLILFGVTCVVYSQR